MNVVHDDDVVSVHDLFGSGFVLLAGPDGASWCRAARDAAEESGAPLGAYRVAADGDVVDKAEEFPTVFGIGRDGAVLVRPDGIVAWRAASADAVPRQDLQRAVRRLLGR